MTNDTLRFFRLPSLAFLLLLAGCSMFRGEPEDPLEELRERVRATVTDDARAEEMLRLVDRMDDKLSELAELVATTAKQERALFPDYDSTRQEYEALFATGMRARRELQQSLLDIHVEFKSRLNDDEWNTILPVQTRAITERTNTLVAAALAKR